MLLTERSHIVQVALVSAIRPQSSTHISINRLDRRAKSMKPCCAQNKLLVILFYISGFERGQRCCENHPKWQYFVE